MSDTEAVASIVAGDADGLATAYDRYADPLFKYCRILLSDPAGAADAVQDTFVIAAARVGDLRDPERLRAWLYTVARNECMRILRSKQGTVALAEAPDLADDAVEASGDVSGDVSTLAARAALRTLFQDATEGLNPGEREVIELQLRQGLDAAEVAAVLGVSRGHAHTMLSRAREQLETCLGVLLVARAGRDECGELGSLLAGGDGRLTVLVRKRVQRHIERCATCSARRAFELRPAMLLDLTPGAALAAGAAGSFRQAPGVPPGLRAHTVVLATGHGASAAAHSAAVLSRAGTFGKNGFPKAGTAGGKAWGAGHGGRAKAGLRSSPQGQAAVAAAVVIGVIIAGTAVALSGNSAHLTAADDPEPSARVAASGAAGAARPSALPSTARATSAGATRATRAPAKPAGTPTAGPQLVATAAAPTVVTTSAAATVPSPASTQPSGTAPSAPPTPPQQSPTPPPAPGSTSPSSPPSTSPAPSPSPSPALGTLTVYGPGGPHGGLLVVIPGGPGGSIFLRASGGTVNWSVSVANDPGGVISVWPSSSGTLTSSSPTITLTITASQAVQCGPGSNAACPSVSVSPGSASYVVWTGWVRPPHHRRHLADGLQWR